MITTAFIEIVNYLLTLALSVFPNSTGLPEIVHTSAVAIGGYARTFDAILPIDTIFTVVSLVITVQLGILAFKSFKWIISHVPFVGGRG